MRNRMAVLAAAVTLAACSKAPVPESKSEKPAAEVTPADFKVNLETSKGVIVIRVVKEWSPNGADRFYKLVKSGYYDGARFFRMLPGFIVQFGIAGDPSMSALFRQSTIPDDAVTNSNKKGFVTFATAGPNTRTTQVFINLGDNERLDDQGFSPFGKVVSGMDVAESLYSGYGEGAPRGNGPEQGRIENEGNKYLEGQFPRLDFIRKAAVAP